MRRTPSNVCSVFHELESRTESKGERGAAEDPSWVPGTHNWPGSFQPLLMLALGDPTEASVIMYAFPQAVTRHMQNRNERNCQRRKWAEHGHCIIALCSWLVEATWAAATSSLQPVFLTVNACTLQPSAQTTLLPLQLLQPGYQFTATRKAAHTESLLQATQVRVESWP